MKRILMVCCLLAASTTYSSAQQTAPAIDAAKPVSKTEFTQKVNELNSLLAHDKTADATTKFNEINDLINGEIKVMHYKMRDANNETDRHTHMEKFKKQRGLYGQIMSLKENMTGNKTALVEKLNEFAESI